MAVADVFTAVTEDRPYRKGMSPDEATTVLEKLAKNGGLDAEVVETLRRNRADIAAARHTEQAEYASNQKRREELVGREITTPSEPAVLAGSP